MTDDEAGAATGSVSLLGLGSGPVVITFTNDASGQSNVVVTPNNSVDGVATQVDSGEDNHAQFQVVLQPQRPPFPAPR